MYSGIPFYWRMLAPSLQILGLARGRACVCVKRDSIVCHPLPFAFEPHLRTPFFITKGGFGGTFPFPFLDNIMLRCAGVGLYLVQLDASDTNKASESWRRFNDFDILYTYASGECRRTIASPWVKDAALYGCPRSRYNDNERQIHHQLLVHCYFTL